jgi:2-polyprenyl-6-methoxyphenol hydroxylase-like FAD-dependent oxidoreductase
MRNATRPVQALSVYASDGSSVMSAFTGLVEARPTERAAIWFDTACVLGGSIAGLLAARVLADHARQVVVIDKDEVSVDGHSRAGVPQDRQVHVLLPGGQHWLERWLPGLASNLLERGAVLSGPGQFVQYADGRPQVHERPLLTASRPLLESRIRAHVLALPNVSTRRSQATGLDYRDGRVTSVRHRSVEAAQVLPADFVVDAMGRASRLADWLGDDGFDVPPLQRLATSINYASALFNRVRPSELTAAVAMFSAPYPVDGVAVAGIGAIEHDQWLVLLMGYDDSRPGRTPQAFRDTCAKLPPAFAEATRDAVTGEIFTYHQADSRRRDYAGEGRFPAGLVSVGDAVASFNPIYAQGMSAAALHASCLAQYLRTEPVPAQPATAFFDLERIVVDAAWTLSAGGDAARLDALTGAPVPEDVSRQRWALDQLMQAAPVDQVVARALNDVTFMLAHPGTLADPALLERAMAANQQHPL